MEETYKPKTKTKPKKSHSEIIIDIYARNERSKWLKQIPQESSEFPTDSGTFTP